MVARNVSIHLTDRAISIRAFGIRRIASIIVNYENFVFIINVYILGDIFERSNGHTVFFGYPFFVVSVNVTVENGFRFGVRGYRIFGRVFAVFDFFGRNLAALMISYGIHVDFDARYAYNDIARRVFGRYGKRVITVESRRFFFAVAHFISYGNFAVRLSVFIGKRDFYRLRFAVFIRGIFARNRAVYVAVNSYIVSRQRAGYFYGVIFGSVARFCGNRESIFADVKSFFAQTFYFNVTFCRRSRKSNRFNGIFRVKGISPVRARRKNVIADFNFGKVKNGCRAGNFYRVYGGFAAFAYRNGKFVFTYCKGLFARSFDGSRRIFRRSRKRKASYFVTYRVNVFAVGFDERYVARFEFRKFKIDRRGRGFTRCEKHRSEHESQQNEQSSCFEHFHKNSPFFFSLIIT